MNFLLTVCAGFLTYYHQVHHCCAVEFDLDAFMKNFEKSQTELKWIRDASRKNEGKEIEWADSKESNFDEDDENSVDHWYNKYRKSECLMNKAGGESKILNGYCGVNDESHIEYPSKPLESNYLKDHPVPEYKIEPKHAKDMFTDTGSLSDNFDNFHEDPEQEHFDVDNLSPEDKVDIEEYNEQMIPNPNFYKINNEMHLNDEQISKDHDSFRNELGFSPSLSSGGDVFTQIENDYGFEKQDNAQRQDIKSKRNTRDYEDNSQRQDIKSKSDTRDVDALSNPNFNFESYGHLSDQDDTRKNDLSHEADYKLSKNEQDSQSKAEPETEQDHRLIHESQIEQRPRNEHKDKVRNQVRNGNKQKNVVPNNLQTGEASNHYNYFQGEGHGHTMKAASKTKLFPKKQIVDSKSRQYQSKHDKSDPLTNEINLKISNRMMSKGLGPSLPSQYGKYYPYRHPMNIDVENQHWKDGGTQNRNDLNDYVGLRRRLLEFDYEEPTNDYPLHENASNEKNLLKMGFIKTLNNKKLADNADSSQSLLTNSSEKRNLEELKSDPDSTIIQLDNLTIGSTTKTNQTEANNTLHGHVDSVKLQLELNVSAMANDRGKIVKRSASDGKQFGLQETKIQGISKNASIRDLVSGKLPNQLIQAVFQLVQENSRLNKFIGSKLDMKIVDNLQLNSINLFKSKQKTEKMVKKLMSSITDLIDEQITHQTCISLPPDLQSFYDKVIYVRSINSRVNNMRKQIKVNANGNSTKRIVRSTVPESDLHQKYKTVGKLLKQFGHLTLRDQVENVDIKQFLQNHMQLLDDLKSFNTEFVRKSRSVESKNNGHDNTETRLLGAAGHISRQYANLLKTTKLIKTTSLTDMNRMDVISTY